MAQQTVTNNHTLTAMQELIAWGDDMLLNHPQKLLSFGEAIDKAISLLELEKQQITEAIMHSLDEDGHTGEWKIKFAKDYYTTRYENPTHK